jgi:hypothetical protein
MRALVLIGLFASCGGDDTYMIVSVDKRLSVNAPTKLAVTLSNAGSMRTDSLDIGGNDFPVTFSLSAPGRSGEIGINIDALDAQGQLVGRGATSTDLTSTNAAVMLDSADFVVNALYANNQFLSNDFEAVGLQMAALGNGIWTVAFREDCMPTNSCTVLARRFDHAGKPVRSELAAGETQFPVSTRLARSGAIPAAAASGVTTLVLWDFIDTVGDGQGVACRAINEQGAAAAGQLEISNDSADVVTVAPLPNGNFVATWQTFLNQSQVVRGVIVTPGCTTLAGQNPYTVSTATGTFGARRSHAAANASTVLYTWIVDGQVHIRTGPLSGTPLGNEVILVPSTASQEVDHVRVVPWGNGFAVAARWGAKAANGPGKLEVYRVSTAGVIQGAPILITDKSGSDFASDKAFGLARRSDDAVMVAWHQCETGPGSCDVYGRILRPTGAPVGEPIVLPTTTGSDQVNPSIVALDASSFAAAWNDSSGVAPDQSGSAVRGRILYPVYDDARGIHGALCGSSAPAGAPACAAGLACALGSDGMQRCYTTCTPPSCPGGGTCSTVDATTSACTF